MAEGPTIELMECPIAGFQFHGGEACWGRIRLSDRLTLRRQPGNRHDPRAITVEWQDVMLGYVPREANYALSQMMDRGAQIEARVKALRQGADPWQRVMMEVVVTWANVAPTPASPPVEEFILAPELISRPPTVILLPCKELTAAQQEAGHRILIDCVQQITRRLALPTIARRHPQCNEVRLWEMVAIESRFNGRRLDVRALQAPTFFPQLSLDLKRPLGAKWWPSCFQSVIEASCERHGMSRGNSPGALRRWVRESLLRAFQDAIDWDFVRKAALGFLAPDPLARSLTNRIYGASPPAQHFNHVAPRAPAIAMCAIEQPAMLPFLRFVLDETSIPVKADLLEALRTALMDHGMPAAAWKSLATWGWPAFDEMCDGPHDVAAIARLLHELDVQGPPPESFVGMAITAAAHRVPQYIALDFDREPLWFHRALLRALQGPGGVTEARILATMPMIVDWILDAQPEPDANQQKAGWEWLVAQAEAHRATHGLAMSKPWRVPVARLSWPGYDVVAIQCARELHEEAQAMKNCLANYESDCRSGEVVVYSIRTAGTDTRVACFAASRLCSKWDLVEVAGKMNQAVSPELRLIANAAVAKLNGRGFTTTRGS